MFGICVKYVVAYNWVTSVDSVRVIALSFSLQLS